MRIWRGQGWDTPALVAAARADARAMDVGWVLVWPQQHWEHGALVRFWSGGAVSYLRRTGFRFAYRADGVLVYRAGLLPRQATGWPSPRL